MTDLQRGASGIVLAVGLTLGLAACGAQSEVSPVLDTTTSFRQAIADGDGQAACELLNDATRVTLGSDCANAIASEDLPGAASDTGTAEVQGRMAIVQFNDDTIFLAKTPDGWRITAAGCVPQTEGPYQCTVEGP
ncbi:hypothetical protein SAMN04489806_2691 [Paramicrobacterium humi]|uniref:Uncharacterized protein n=1 Tax=Paramicrobacterium humi TaxID=640635 RepID=A0A1H4Q2C3_9MICO|nr:hypothetical protein [Microbacterium humi]SEC13783.1 hypothetical protein SAMN04489806_2691 [Microbacterium humi]